MNAFLPLRKTYANAGLRCRETRFCGAETKAPKRHVKSNRQLAETKRAHESPPVRGYSQRAGKSLFARDCVVGPGGLELPTKRLSAACSEHKAHRGILLVGPSLFSGDTCNRPPMQLTSSPWSRPNCLKLRQEQRLGIVGAGLDEHRTASAEQGLFAIVLQAGDLK